MSNIRVRGLEKHDELKGKDLIRDTRSLWVQCLSVLKGKQAYLTVMIMLAAMPVVLPGWTYSCLLLGGILFLIRFLSHRRDRLAFRLPAEANMTDYSDPIPGRRKYFKSGGIFHLGNEYKTMEELWLKGKDVLTHMLLFGTTGSGKTETLVSLAFNSLAMGSGFFYIDPKAAPKLSAQIYTMARFCGRDDDYRVMNYSIAGKPEKPNHPKKLSNTNNPFAFGSAESLTQLLVSLIPKAEGDNAIFGQNAQTLITSVMFALVELRNSGELDLSIDTIRDHLVLQKFDAFARRTDLSDATLAAVKSFLTSVGWQEHQPLEKQPRSLPEQFGYARSYFALPLASLTDTYGHIYKTSQGEVDMFDVIKSRRILVVMLPSLEKAPQELENLGKISLSAVRNAISIGLGDKIEGTVSDVLEALPTDAKTPFLSITDEYAAIPTPGYAEVLTQGRGLGIAAIVASQDYAGITGADEIGAQQIVANTKVKLAMKLEDPKETWELFNALAGESDVMQTDGYHIEKGTTLPLSYRDQQMAKQTKMGRIHMRDLQEQIEGEFHAFFNGEIIRGRAFYANPPLKSDMQIRINQMVPVPLPNKEDVDLKFMRQDMLYQNFKKLVLKEKKDLSNYRQVPDVKILTTVFASQNTLSAADIAIAAFLSWVNKININISESGRKIRQANIPKPTQPVEPEKKEIQDQDNSRKIEKKDPDLLLPNLEDESAGDESFETGTVEETCKSVWQETENLFSEDLFAGENIFEGTGDNMEAFSKDMATTSYLFGKTPQEAAQRGIDVGKQAQKILELKDYPEEPSPENSPKAKNQASLSAMRSAQELLNEFKRGQNAK